MKLFIWEGEGVLSDYTNGMIVALAPDLETALRAIESECNYCYVGFPHSPTSIIDLENNPTPKAWLVWGGG